MDSHIGSCVRLAAMAGEGAAEPANRTIVVLLTRPILLLSLFGDPAVLSGGLRDPASMKYSECRLGSRRALMQPATHLPTGLNFVSSPRRWEVRCRMVLRILEPRQLYCNMECVSQGRGANILAATIGCLSLINE